MSWFKCLSACVVLLCFLNSCDLQDSAKANALNDEGVELLNGGQPEVALEKFREAEKLAHGAEINGQIQRNTALCFHYLNLPDSAASRYGKAKNCFDPNTFDYLINEADQAVYLNRFKQAELLYQNALEADPNRFEVHNALGLLYMGEFDESFLNVRKALIHNERAYKLSPQDPMKENLAISLLENERFEESNEHFIALIESFPQRPELQYYVGYNYFALGDSNRANSFWDNTLLLDSTYSSMISLMRSVELPPTSEK